MKKSLLALTLLASAATIATPRPAAAVGCISGAAVGGVAGHYAGHHGLLGAAAGCAVGHHAAVVRRRNAAAAAQGYATPGTTGYAAPNGAYTQPQ